MKYRIEDIPPEGVEEIFFQDECWLDVRLSGDSRKNFHFTDPIRIQMKLSCTGRMVRMTSRIEARVEWVCDRCLEPFTKTLVSEYSLNLKPKPVSPFPEEIELTREDLDTEFYEGDEIDFTPLVQDQLLLAFPLKALCREECRGLCPICGKNMNQEVCKCPKATVDPRFERLKSFRAH